MNIKFIKNFYLFVCQRLEEATNNAGRQIITFGIVMAIYFPLFFLIWSFESSVNLEGVILRIIMTLLSLSLALKKFWPPRLERFLPLIWHASIILILPFFFVFMALKHNGNVEWLMNLMSAIFFVFLLLDAISAIVCIFIGSILAWLLFKTIHVSFVLDLGSITVGGLVSTLIAAFIIGGIFSRNRDYLAKEKLQIMKLLSLERENVTLQKMAASEAQLLEKEKFSQTVDQVAHDIRSPLASLLMILKSCQAIPEPQRVALREAANSINDIANNLLHQYKLKEKLETSATEERKPLLVSATLLEVLTDKKYQYQALSVNFDHLFDQSGYFAFIKINVSDFKRMMSNLINNAVDAFEGNAGNIILKLVAEELWVKVTIQDNGKGMSEEVANKIMNKIAFTSGKKEGHGIGMVQIRETLEATQGEMDIHSVLGEGTQITLTFPRVGAPSWIAEEITLNQDDVVIILDDDSSIHGAWDTHFASLLKTHNHLQLKHFAIGQDALDFIDALSPEAKQKIFLLSDYELLKQNLNGLDVMKQSGITRAILVTSHYANSAVCDKAVQMGIKILPKQMAPEVPIKINDKQESKGESKNVDLVIIDDSASFVESVMTYLKEINSTQDRPYQIDHYTDPNTFLENLSRYPKDTKISLDNDFGVSALNGLQLAQKLYEQGYTKLYLLSGKDFEVGEVPSYIMLILKTDLDTIARI